MLNLNKLIEAMRIESPDDKTTYLACNIPLSLLRNVLIILRLIIPET